MGDMVNTTARLASAAATGEILSTDTAIANAQLPNESIERRQVALKGKSEVIDVRVLRATTLL